MAAVLTAGLEAVNAFLTKSTCGLKTYSNDHSTSIRPAS